MNSDFDEEQNNQIDRLIRRPFDLDIVTQFFYFFFK